MSIKLHLPKLTDMRPRLTVVGVGGAGCNAVNNMILAGLTGVDFVVANTDAQSLIASSAEMRIQLGASLTEGLGAGSKPEIGEAAAEESIDEIRGQVAGAHMVFIAAGMGGGTGTGAASVIARAARDMGILTVGVVTKPFQFEGSRRMRIAEAGIAELKKYVDTLIVIPNQNLFRIANEKTTFAEAFVLADQVLYSGVACVVDLIIKEGLINLDFADVRTVMSGMGTAMMGTGEASGERRAILAAEEAISNPLLDDVSLKGARGLLLSITGGRDLTLYEVDEAASRVRKEVDPEANIIVGATFDDSLGDRVRVSIVASGMERAAEHAAASYERAAESAAPRAANGAAPGAEPRPSTASDYAPAQAGDIERRLSEAIQYGPAGDTYDNPADARGHQRQHPAPAREGWRAPGNVVIEEGLSHLAAQPSGRHAAQQPDTSAPPAFTPSAPADVRRGGRRMPDVEDFPPMAQAEYRAKSQGPNPGPAQPPAAQGADQRRRPGIFARITGIGRGADDSRQTSGASTPQGAHNAPQGASAPRTFNRAPADSRAPGAPREQVDLPEFFGGKRK